MVWNLSYPNKPFTEVTGGSLTVRPYKDDRAASLTRDELIDHLITHGIPPAWIDHAYTFGLHHLNHYSNTKVGLFHDLYCKTNQERLERLDQLGIPPAIPEWDGWWCPTYDDITRIQLLMHIDGEENARCGFQDFEWLLVGAPTIFRELTGPALRENVQSQPNKNDPATASPRTIKPQQPEGSNT
jgi:hypothetical protein